MKVAYTPRTTAHRPVGTMDGRRLAACDACEIAPTPGGSGHLAPRALERPSAVEQPACVSRRSGCARSRSWRVRSRVAPGRGHVNHPEHCDARVVVGDPLESAAAFEGVDAARYRPRVAGAQGKGGRLAHDHPRMWLARRKPQFADGSAKKPWAWLKRLFARRRRSPKVYGARPSSRP